MTVVACIQSVAPIGFDGSVVEVESDIKNGLPSLQVVGLTNRSIDEAKERVRSAISNSLLDFPAKKLVVNLAPAELPKDGTHYDLAIALSILVSSGQLHQDDVANSVFAGELALNGDLRPVKGIISIVETAKKNGAKSLFIPLNNVPQALLVKGVDVYGVKSLQQLFLHLRGEARIEVSDPSKRSNTRKPTIVCERLDDIHGQEQAKRALTIAAAGHHNILFTGPPGAGKTMLARTLVSLLPDLSEEEQITVTKLHSLAGESIDEIITSRPFRSPHHTSSRIALIGGGVKPKPGEISLAHLGVLFLDEIPEYSRATLESLRQPLEDRQISISRTSGYAKYPADFMLVATMNPCPCGYYGDNVKECTCTSTQILSYQKRLSGPLMDRIDMVIPVSRVPTETLLHNTLSYSHHNNAKKVIQIAKTKQSTRYMSSNKYNSSLTSSMIKALQITSDAKDLLKKASDTLNLSARGYFKVIKVARTIADIDSSNEISSKHIAESLQYRQ